MNGTCWVTLLSNPRFVLKKWGIDGNYLIKSDENFWPKKFGQLWTNLDKL